MATLSPRSIIRGAIRSYAPAIAGLIAPLGLLACRAASPESEDASRPRAAPVSTVSASAPTVIELFQSQGCSSCPPANANVNAIAATRSDVLALSFSVTYWDRLGWDDSFAKPEFTARQWDYANFVDRGNVSTPQVIINGRTAVVGADRAKLDRDIAAAGSPKGGPAIALRGRTVELSGGAGTSAGVWLVRYDPRTHDVPILAGENGGRTLPHRNIVRELTRLGDWTGGAVSFDIPAPSSTVLRSAILVQQDVGGPILAARRL